MNQLKAGIARRDVTPPFGTLLFGYPNHRPGEVVADPLAATALVLQTQDTSAAIIALDWCVIDEEETAAIRTAITERTKIAPQNITICASHTHSGPATVEAWGWAHKNTEYLDGVRGNIVDAVAEAQASLQPVRVGIGKTSTDTGINRREVYLDGTVNLGNCDWGPYDSDLTVVRFEGEGGPIGQIVHLSAHPTSRASEPSVSRDWPGVMVDRVEKITGAPVVFLNGAYGDVAPRSAIRSAVGDGAAAAEEVGLRAASHAIRAWHSIKEFRDDVELHTHSAGIELPFAPLPPLEEAEAKLAELGDKKDAMGPEGAEWNFFNAVREAHASEPKTSRTFAQTITQIGPVAIVPFAGEIFSEIALRVKHYSPFQHTLCLGSCNGSHGYYVTRESRGRGGYEVWVARAFGAFILADNIDDVLVRENTALLNQLAGQ